MKKFFPSLQYINLPNIITTLGLVFGIIACWRLIMADLRTALICLFFSAFMDLVDGFFAEKFKCKTQFGQYMDSLVDFFICCVMPSLMALIFIGNSFVFIGAITLYCICGLWRLAYFNVTAVEKRDHFTGLPVPGAMLFAVMSVWFTVHCNIPAWVSPAVFTAAGLFMISFIKLKKYGMCQKALWVMWIGFLALIVLS